MGGGAGAPVVKAKNFLPSAKRLLGTLRQDASPIIIVLVLGVLSVALTVTGPTLLGLGTNIVFNGFISLQFPKGTTKAQIIDQLTAAGHAVRWLAARGAAPAPTVDYVEILLLGSRHPRILGAKAELDAGRVPADFDALTAEIIEALSLYLIHLSEHTRPD